MQREDSETSVTPIAPKNLRAPIDPYPHLRDDDGCVLARDCIDPDKVAYILNAVNGHAGLVAALKAVAGPLEAIREDQVSQGLRLGRTHAERAERQRLLATWVAANADKLDDALEQVFAALSPISPTK